ncbi:hypothetical protein EH228_06320 [Erwinia endophytica]|nr:hypothetical protein EH228_06320 [Erwinia endophytica]
MRSTKPVTRLSSSPTDLTFDQTTSPGGFFVYKQGDYSQTERISRRSWIILLEVKEILCR